MVCRSELFCTLYVLYCLLPPPLVSLAQTCGATVSSWQGIYIPAKTSPAVVALLRGAIVKAITDPKAVEALKSGGAGPMDRALLDDCTAFTRQQAQFWADLVRKVGLAGKQ